MYDATDVLKKECVSCERDRGLDSSKLVIWQAAYTAPIYVSRYQNAKAVFEVVQSVLLNQKTCLNFGGRVVYEVCCRSYDTSIARRSQCMMYDASLTVVVCPP